MHTSRLILTFALDLASCTMMTTIMHDDAYPAVVLDEGKVWT